MSNTQFRFADEGGGLILTTEKGAGKKGLSQFKLSLPLTQTSHFFIFFPYERKYFIAITQCGRSIRFMGQPLFGDTF